MFAAPVWIYQLWAFIVPGLYGNEKRWAVAVMLTAVPLFLGGVVLCYWLLPKGLTVLSTTVDSCASRSTRFSTARGCVRTGVSGRTRSLASHPTGVRRVRWRGSCDNATLIRRWRVVRGVW